jgi:hypothetical protein
MPNPARVHESTKGEGRIEGPVESEMDANRLGRSHKCIFSSFLRRVEMISCAPMHISYS